MTTTRAYMIGKSNNAAPRMYEEYNCQDHLNPKERKAAKPPSGRMKLDLALEAFNSLVTEMLSIAPAPRKIKLEELLEYQNKVCPERLLQTMLTASPLAQDVRLELSDGDKQLYLCRNYIVELNENVRDLVNITVFQTCCNYLRRMPCSIGHLKRLKMLIVSRNRLVSLPAEVGFCRELREIDISYNLLSSLPHSIVALKKLNTLHITGNKFSSLPTFLGKLSSLKYFGVGQNPLVSIPLEIFKLPFLLSLTFDQSVPNPSKRFEEVGELTFLEALARRIVRNNLPIPRNMPSSLREYLLSVQECAFCSGPFFGYYIDVEDVHCFESIVYPINYRMCCRHYDSHDQRLPSMFERRIDTTPQRLLQDNMPSVSELFDPFVLDEAQLKRAQDGIRGGGFYMPLISLAELNSAEFNEFRASDLLDDTNERLNGYDVEI